MKSDIVPKARKENLVVQELDGEVLIYDLKTDKAFCLNESSALVWQACDGNRDVSEIRKFLGKQLNSQVDDDFVWLALDQLKKENLIENKDEIVADFGGMSRRAVIRKVGLASVVALPLISSLVAPTALSAQSPGSVCTGSCTCTPATSSGQLGAVCTTTASTCTSACANCRRASNGNNSTAGTCSAT